MEQQRPTIEALVDAYHQDAFRSALFLTGNEADADDLVQQTFLRVMERIYQLRDPAAAKPWILAILRNCFLQDKRRLRQIPLEDLDVPDLSAGDGGAAVHPGIVDLEPHDVAQAMQALDEHHRVALTMYYFERRSYQEIARELNIKLGTVMSRLSRAKQQLRLALMQHLSD